MSNINQFPTADTLQGGDLLLEWSAGNSDTRKFSLTALVTFLNESLTFPGGKAAFVTQYFAPNATGFNAQITDNSDNTWLVLTPDADYAAGTIMLPAVANVVDKQEVLVNSTQAVTTLTIDGNGASSVVGAPTTLAINDFFKLKYDITLSRWYRVG